MRGEFNNTFTVRYGSRSVVGPPGVTYGTGIPCRFVPQRQIDQGQFDFTLTSGWFTNDSLILNGPLVSSPWLGAYFTDQLAADEVSFASSPEVWYSVSRRETVNPYLAAGYERYLLVNLLLVSYPTWPPPSPPPPNPYPPPVVPLPPGGGCGSGYDFGGFGEFLMATQSDGASGYYESVITYTGDIHIRLLGDMPSDVVVLVSQVNPFYACCDAVLAGEITYSGSRCVSLHNYGEEPVAERVCIVITNLSLDSVREVTIEVGPGPCGV